MMVNLASLMAPAIQPDQDLTNPGWRFPRYVTEVIRILAFLRRADQQAIVQELMYCALMGSDPSGVLEGVSRKTLRELVQQAYAKASGEDQS